MIALLPRDPAPWVIPGGEPAEELHVTIQYLSNLALYDPTQVKAQLDALSGTYGPIEARVMSHATFNPDGGANGDKDPCAVYGISDSPQLAELAAVIQDAFPDPEAHRPWQAHMTAGYGFVAGDLRAIGPITFDRIRLAFGEEITDFPL